MGTAMMKLDYRIALTTLLHRTLNPFGAIGLLTLIATSTAAATPAITSVDAPTLSDGKQITISGTGFGSGPHVLLFDDFNGGTVGSPIPLKANDGSWTATKTAPPVYGAYGLDGSTGFLTHSNATLRQFALLFPANEQEMFISYWVAITPGTYFPGANSPDTFSTFSSWKQPWAMYGDYGGCSDAWIPAWNGSTWNLAGNDHSSTLMWLGPPSWFGFERYTRISFWIKANTTDPTLPGNIAGQILQDGRGIVQTWTGTPAIFDNSNQNPQCPAGTPKAWDRVYAPGWMSIGNGGASQPVYDDFYIAVGPDAQARIEIGNASTYAASTDLELLTPDVWSSTQITATLHQGPFTSLDNLYVYVVDANGNVNDTGFPLGSSSTTSSSTSTTTSTSGTSTTSTSTSTSGTTSTSTATTSTPPEVYISSPTSGTALNSVVTLSAYATSPSGAAITQVSIDLDGALQCSGAPSVSCNWNTRKSSNGNHTISASAEDAAGNKASTQITVSVSNSCRGYRCN